MDEVNWLSKTLFSIYSFKIAVTVCNASCISKGAGAIRAHRKSPDFKLSPVVYTDSSLTSESLERIVNDDFRELKPDKVRQSTDDSNTESYTGIVVKHSSGHRDLSGVN